MQQTRKQLIQRVLVYSLMSLSVVVIVTLLMLAVLGYSFNPKDNSIEQGGLLQFGSVPSGAIVTLDEMQLSARTPSKTTAEASHHNVSMKLDGYRTWQKSIDLKPGMIGWLSYARLVPTDVKVQKARALPTLAGALASPDRKWFALLEDAAKPAVLVANLQNDEVTYKELVLPAISYTAPTAGKTQAFSIDSWSQNGEYIILRHTYDDGKNEWILVNREDPAKTKNISARLGLTSDRLLFAARDGRTALAMTDATSVRRLNLSDETISRPLITNADEFSVFNENVLMYTTKADPVNKLRTVGYLGDGMEIGQPLTTFPDDGQAIHSAMSEYFGKRYVAWSHGTSVQISVGSLPKQDNKGGLKSHVTFSTPAPITKLTFSSNGRFVIAEMSNGYTVHDLELGKTDTTVLKDVTVARSLRWLDPFMTWYDAGGMLRLYEFDGANQQNLTTVAEGFDVVISPNQKFLYSIGRDATGLHLQRVRMVLN